MNERVLAGLARELGAEHVASARLPPGGPELPLAAPSSADGFRAALALARRERWTVRPCGLGSKLAREGERVDFLLSTRNYRGVVAYEPGDGTLTARAGSSMAELAARVAEGGHALTPDVPRPHGSTLGGVIAAGQSAPDRLRYGPVRDHVLGMQFALADGTLAKSGGRLVKNVTGYDLQRLFTGSDGTLGVILEASLRLFPLPEEHCLVSATAPDSAQLAALAHTLLATDARLISLGAQRADSAGPWTVAVRLGGRREVVEAEREAVVQLLSGAEVLDGEAALTAARELRDALPAPEGGPLLQVDALPAELEAALAALEAGLQAARGAFEPRWWCDPGIARIDVELRPRGADPELLARVVTALRAALAPLRARVRIRGAPAELAVDPRGEPRAGLELMRAIRARLDPDSVLPAGRFSEAR